MSSSRSRPGRADDQTSGLPSNCFELPRESERKFVDQVGDVRPSVGCSVKPSARILAARCETSTSALLAYQIECLVGDEEAHSVKPICLIAMLRRASRTKRNPTFGEPRN
jgi:hypothetical protein